MRQHSGYVVAAILGLGGLLLSASCAKQNTDSEGDGPTSVGGSIFKSTDSPNAGGSGATDPTSVTIKNNNSNSCVPQADDAGCVGAAYEGESIGLDILVMFDLSCSMSCTVKESGCCLPANENVPDTWRLQPVRSAMKTFLQDPASAGIGVGLSFFGNHALDMNHDPEVCSVGHYTNPTVEIAPLPGNAPALMSALDAGMPEGGTPTQLAIDGACAHATSWINANAGRKVVILLVTDGIPEYSCNATIQNAVTSAKNCYAGGSGTQVYVLGISSNNNGSGSSLTQLNQIAVAGGTDQAYLTDTNDVSGSVLQALNAIRADAVIPCDLAIPSPPNGQEVAPDQVNIGICDPTQTPVVAPYVGSISNCGSDPGWYYDNPAVPSAIHLCDNTCATVKAPGTTLFFSVGCKTKDITGLL